MMTLEIPSDGGVDRHAAAWAASLLVALARDEAAGRRTQRLTEPSMATWRRFRGRLSAPDLVEILFEDAAVIHRIPFARDALGSGVRSTRLPESVCESWLEALPGLDLQAPAEQYVAAQARLLGIPSRLARSDLHVVKPHQKVLELPGTGGQLAHHLVSSQPDLSLRDNLTVACGSWRELTLAGIVGLDLGAPDTEFVVSAEVAALRDADHPLRRRSFDFVVGLHPDKGGLFRVEDQLAIWFSSAKFLLV